MTSLPPRERGLKSPRLPIFKIGLFVAPPAGAWIEIDEVLRGMTEKAMSLPPRERGLKSIKQNYGQPEFTSLPPRERGLK